MRGRLTIATLFIVASAGVAAWFGRPFLEARGAAKLRHLPGPLSDGHAQIAMACDGCHTPYGGVSNDACQKCHADGLAGGEDAHPESKFTDPRNADRLAKLDARRCTTCHQEHLPERTSRGGVTLPVDFCRSCHEDIAKDRPSHQGLAFTTCSATGCHNFHDNRALHESFLAKHLGEPRLLASPQVAPRTPPPAKPWTGNLALDDAPPGIADAAVTAVWAGSAHRRGQVGCKSCHAPGDAVTWERKPSLDACRTCHEEQSRGDDGGKHGMREAAGLPAMSPELARRPMKDDARGKALGCVSCHDAHAVDVHKAAVEACSGCHDDAHTRAYAGTPHARAWEAELAGAAPPGSGVSCATCHLPRDARDGRTRVEHNQNANLRPTTKMVRTVCARCHGVGYALDALADAALVERNFDSRPAARIATTEWVERRVLEKTAKQRDREANKR